MIFDKLVKAVELNNQLKFLYATMRKAALFVFPDPPHKVLPKVWDEAREKYLREHFHLPFPITAVEDPASCVILMDGKENVRGLGDYREFVQYTSDDAPASAFYDGNEKRKKCGFDLLSIGRVALKEDGGDARHNMILGNVAVLCVMVDGKIASLYAAAGKGLENVTGPVPADGERCELLNCFSAMEELAMLNTPDKFILETTPRGCKDCKKIPRAHQRPLYTILKPGVARQTMGLSEEPVTVRGSPDPHWRRAHTRVYKADRFVNVKGKVKHISAVWVGPSEAEHNGKKYRVLLDR